VTLSFRVSEHIEAASDSGEVREHARLLAERLDHIAEPEEVGVALASVYLAQLLRDASTDWRPLAQRFKVDAATLLNAAFRIRSEGRYRAYAADWIAAGSPSVAKAFYRPAVLTDSAPADNEADPPRRVSAPVREGFVRRIVRSASRMFNSWTGTAGTHSYYDKDSSPD